jgi:hypothetical protein
MKKLRFSCPACFRTLTIFNPTFIGNTPDGAEYECACYFCKAVITITEKPVETVHSAILKKDFDINLN